MSSVPDTPVTPASGGEDYVRGVRATPVSTGRVLRVVALICLLGLVVAEIAVLVAVTTDKSLGDKLRRHGVPVHATVTGCVAISSGIGMGTEYYECRGAYSLGGQTYTAVIRGSRSLLRTGDTVAAVAVPGDPSLLATPASAARHQSAWRTYLVPIILGALIVVLVLASLAWVRRHPQRST